jgi:UDP-glucose 4-epimerase
LHAGLAAKITDRTINLGGPEALSLLEIAQCCARLCGDLPVTTRPFPEDRAAIDIGSYVTDSSLFERTFGWKPSIRFEQGIAATIAYYRTEIRHYLDPNDPRPNCGLPEHRGIQHRLRYAAV